MKKQYNWECEKSARLKLLSARRGFCRINKMNKVGFLIHIRQKSHICVWWKSRIFYANAYNMEFSTKTWLYHTKVWKTPLKMCKTHGFSRLVKWVFQLFHAFGVWKSWKTAFELHKCLKFECRKKYIFTFPLDRIYSFEVNLFTVRKNILV